MKYKDIIELQFNKYKLIPRENQIKVINNILTLYLDNNKKYVVLSAPTGSGKSIIAVILVLCLAFLDPLYDLSIKSYILMHNKALQHQYINNFKDYNNFINVMGASNYECKHLKGTGLDCVIKGVNAYNTKMIPSACKNCSFRLSRIKYPEVLHVITNYSFYFVMTLNRNVNKLANRLITIYDLSHLINDIFCSHILIKLTSKVFLLLQNMLVRFPTRSHNVFDKQLVEYKLQLLNGTLTTNNYESYLLALFNTLNKIKELYVSIVSLLYEQGDIGTCKSYNKITSRLTNMCGRYLNLQDYEYEFVTDVLKGTFLIQPIFVGKTFGITLRSKYCLFMSATNLKKFTTKTLQLDLDKTVFIKAKPTFPPSSKLIIFINHLRYNYTNLNNINIINGINEYVYNIVELHKQDKGVILVPSFRIMDNIVKYLNSKRLNLKVFVHIQGLPLGIILDEFKHYSNPSVLISPSLWEGISLDDNISRYQIIIKTPYLNLGLKRVKYILDNYPEIYQIQTLFRLIQGFGRSTRNIDDYSTTYCLDTSSYTLFNSKYNVWKDLFKALTLD